VIPEVSSVPDYAARRLAFDFMPAGDRIKLVILTPEEQARALG
jgi:hypothetical protein